jgi:hypothetical protein
VAGRRLWLVPDLDGLHITDLAAAEETLFIPYPDFALKPSQRRSGVHALRMNLPRLLNLDAGAEPELVFQGDERVAGWHLGQREPSFNTRFAGTLIDLDGDGLADRMEAEHNDDVDRMRDLPDMTTRIRTYPAHGPLDFAAEPLADQDVPGLVLQDFDADFEIAPPFLDINGDGRLDLMGVAFKLNAWQAIRALTTGRLNFRFHLHLTLQEPDGTFRALAGGPFVMVWKINIRRLKLPSFAQITADFDGDGWLDLLMQKGRNLRVTPVTAAGIHLDREWKRTIPKPFRDAEQIYGRDLDGDGKAEFVLMVVTQGRTRLAVLEHGQ